MALQMSPKIIVLSLAGLYFLYYLLQAALLSYRRHIFKRAKGCQPLPKYPQNPWSLGADILFENIRVLKVGGFPQLVKGRYDRMGVFTWTSMLPGQTFIHTSEPENIKAILATQFKDFELPASRKTAFGPVFGHGIFTNNGEDWGISRALLRPNFNRAQVADLEALETHVSKVIARIPKDGSTVDLQVLFFMLTVDSATEFLFGHSSGTLDAGTSYERGIKFAQAFTDATLQTGLVARIPERLSFLVKNKKFKDDVAYVHEYVSGYVQKAVDMHKLGTKKSEKYVFLEELAATGQSAKKIQDELLNILLAGRDTTAGLLSYLFYTLAREPGVFKKLRAEVDQLGGKKPTYDEVKGMKYLAWVLNEALRLFPVVPLNAREAVKDTTLPLGGGPDGKSPVFVSKGRIINYQPYVMHRRKDLYGEDAEEFKPERWETLRPGWGYVPFNGGPRICIGQQYALMEASYATIRILQNFKAIESKDDTPFKELLTLTAAVQGGVHVALTPV